MDTAPAWSPDGRQLAWASDGDLYVMAADGAGKRRRIVPGTAQATEPAWAPGGGRIVFASNLEGTFDLWTVDLATGALEPVVQLPGDEHNPAFSLTAGRSPSPRAPAATPTSTSPRSTGRRRDA